MRSIQSKFRRDDQDIFKIVIITAAVFGSLCLPQAAGAFSIFDIPNPGANNLKNFGYSIVDGVDLDQDSTSDFIMCGYYEGSSGQNKQGRCWAISGDDGSVILDFGNPTPQSYNITAGFLDLDQNGFMDVVMGSELKATGKTPLVGEGYVFFLGPDRKNNLSVIKTQTVSSPEQVAGARFGHSVATFNGTPAIVAFGTPGLGKAYLYKEMNNQLVPVLDALGNHRFLQEQGDQFGYSMANVGGYLMIGAPSASDGAVYMFSHSGNGIFSLIDTHTISGGPGFGKFLTSLGNVDGLGGEDFAVGTHDGQGLTAGDTTMGDIFVYDIEDTSASILSFDGNRAASVGAWNCDSNPDIAVGSAWFDISANTYHHSQVIVYSGRDGSLLATLENSNWDEYDGFGYSIAVGGNMKDDLGSTDGEPEIVIGAPGFNDRRGHAYAFMGRPEYPDGDKDGTPDECDNCYGHPNAIPQAIYNPSQTDRDGDGWGDSCDNCVKIPNGVNEADVPNVGNQSDSDSDGIGDACETLTEVLAAAISNTCKQNEECWFKATFINDTGAPIVTIEPDCFNTTLTLYDSNQDIQPPLYRKPRAYRIGDSEDPLDVDHINGGGDSRTVLCNITQMFSLGKLNCGKVTGGTQPYYVQATNSNFITDPRFDPATLACIDDEDCFDLDQYAVSSNLVPLTIICPIETIVDIKPGPAMATINVGLNGNIPVAILSTSDFDATTINPWTTKLEGANNRLKSNNLLQYSITDVNGDLEDDLMLHFEIEGFSVSPTGETEPVIFTGRTSDGRYVEGIDYVRIID